MLQKSVCILQNTFECAGDDVHHCPTVQRTKQTEELLTAAKKKKSNELQMVVRQFEEALGKQKISLTFSEKHFGIKIC